MKEKCQGGQKKTQKALEREAKKAQTLKTKKAKKHKSSSDSKRRKIADDVSNDDDEEGLQCCEISNNECATCFGQWDDDDDADEWLQCTNEEYVVWSHADCLEKCDDAYICVLYQACFM